MKEKRPGQLREFIADLKPGRKLIFFIISFGVALALTKFLSAPGFNDSQNYVLFLLFFSIGLWVTEAIPPFAVALFIMSYLVVTLGNPRFNSEPQQVDKYVQTFSNSIIWLILSGFFLAESMSRTGLDTDFFRFSMKLSGNKPNNILLGIMVTTMVASSVLSNTATTSMMIASIIPVVRSNPGNSFAKSLILGIPLAATIGGMSTIIATPANAIAVGALENNGVSVSFLNWMRVGVPLAIVLTFACWFLLSKIYIKGNYTSNIEITVAEKNSDEKNKRQRVIVIVVLTVTVLFWLTTSLHKLSVSAVSIIPIVSLTMTGILRAEDIRKLPWDTLLLVAGGLSLGLSLQETRQLEHFSRNLVGSPLPPITLYFIFAYLTMIFSNIMSNTATATILIPLGIYLMPDHIKQITVIIGLATSTSLLLPVSTPPNAIAYSTGFIEQKDLLKGGLLVSLIGPALVVLLTVLLL
jgi:sodium-dependent dicarboxylate transporter 2/3/5